MENKLVDILSNLELEQDIDVILQGSLDSVNDYPDNFFTYWNWETPREGYYDNKHSKVHWGYQISAYSTDRKFLLEMMEQAIKKLEDNNFIIDSEGEDIACESKNHTGKMIEILFIEKKEEKKYENSRI